MWIAKCDLGRVAKGLSHGWWLFKVWFCVICDFPVICLGLDFFFSLWCGWKEVALLWDNQAKSVLIIPGSTGLNGSCFCNTQIIIKSCSFELILSSVGMIYCVIICVYKHCYHTCSVDMHAYMVSTWELLQNVVQYQEWNSRQKYDTALLKGLIQWNV